MPIELYPRSITTEKALFCQCGGGIFYPYEAGIQAIQTEDGERYFAKLPVAEGEGDCWVCGDCGRLVQLEDLLLRGER